MSHKKRSGKPRSRDAQTIDDVDNALTVLIDYALTGVIFVGRALVSLVCLLLSTLIDVSTKDKTKPGK